MNNDWLLSIGIKKAVKSLAILLVAKASAMNLESIGVKIDWPLFQDALTYGLFTGLVFLRNWLKNKHDISWL